MKLHLPKSLLVAVLAACVGGQTAWGTWGENDTFYFTGTETTMSTDEEGHDNATTYLKAASDGTGNTGTIDSVTIGQSDKLVVTGYWGSETANFEALTINALAVGSGSELQVAGAQAANNASIGKQNVTINSMTGTLSKLTVLDKGNLTLGKEGDTSSTYTIGSGNIASGATLTLAGGTTTMGNGAKSVEAAGKIVVNADATLKFADTDITHWSNKTNISLLGANGIPMAPDRTLLMGRLLN
ncbi:MAG: hypothetical protein IJB33_07685 [Akkermansia sp.]|nr:hypothetical protein [Akkermansia sp.]